MGATFDLTFHLNHLLASTTQLSPGVYILVLAAGTASALSPCYVPVLAMFAGYVGGNAGESRATGLHLAIPFVGGNAVTLALVGGLVALVGGSVLQVFTGYQLDRWIPGVIGLIMGLQLLGILRLRMPEVPASGWARRPDTPWKAFSLGLPFGLVVTPCTIPVFVAIATFVAFQASALHRALLMVAYALGRGAILLAVAVSAGLLKGLNIGRTAHYAERISGVLILVVSLGLLLFYDAYVRFTGQRMPMAH